MEHSAGRLVLRRRGGQETQQLQRARLEQRVIAIPALRGLHARRAPRLALTRTHSRHRPHPPPAPLPCPARPPPHRYPPGRTSRSVATTRSLRAPPHAKCPATSAPEGLGQATHLARSCTPPPVCAAAPAGNP